MKTYTTEELEEINIWADMTMAPTPLPEEIIAKVGPKPPEARLLLLVLEDNRGFGCGIAKAPHFPHVAPIIFDSIEKAACFAILSFKYGDIMALARTPAAGEA